jgi:urease accessory protein
VVEAAIAVASLAQVELHNRVHETGWQAHLRLGFARHLDTTELTDRAHHGPLRVQRPFYPEGPGVCHVYVLHPPGGIVAGDQLSIDVSVASAAHALLTTPAATKLYRSGGARALQSQQLRVAAGARLEWLPQETIAFDGAQVDLQTKVVLSDDARFLGWEILCLGRPAAHERFEHGELRPALEIWRDDKLQYVERGVYRGGSALLAASFGLRGEPVVGTMVCAAPGVATACDAARAALTGVNALAAISSWDDVLVARYLGPSSEQARELFCAIWNVLRPLIMGVVASPPRIWRT